MTNPQSFLIFSLTMLLIYVLFLSSGFTDCMSLRKFIQKKLFFAMVLGLIFILSEQESEYSVNYTFLTVFIAWFCGTSKLVKECPNEYTENVLPIIKSLFVFIVPFASFELSKERLGATIGTVLILSVLSVAAWFVTKADEFEPKSSRLEQAFLCGENIAALVIASFMTQNPFMRMVITVIFNEIIFVVVHLLIMYLVKVCYNEDTSEYADEKRKELLGL